jgi:hypothetical protein
VPPLMSAIFPLSLAMKGFLTRGLLCPREMGTPTARAMAPAVDFCRALLSMFERRPAPVFFVPAGTLLARVVQQPPRDIFPDGTAAKEADSVHGLNFHDPFAAPAEDAQHVVLDLRQLSLSHPNAVSGAWVLEQRLPIFGRKRFVWSRSRDRRPPGGLGGQFFHLFRCRYAPARGSIGHSRIRT